MTRAAAGRLLVLTLTLAVTLPPPAASEDEPNAEALVSRPRPYAGDLYAAADGYDHQPSYESYQPSYESYQPSYDSYQPSYQPSYGYEGGDDCGDLDLLGVLAGGAALAALGVYILVTQAAAAAARSGGSHQLAGLEDQLGAVFLGSHHRRNFADTTVNITCRVAEMLSGTPSDESPAGQRSDGSDCFSGLIGALAGFAALGALIAYALFLAAQAAAAGRSLGHDGQFGFEIDAAGLSLVSQMALLFVQQDEPVCLPHRLCRINQRARRVGPTQYLVAKLASLPASWFLSSRLAPGGVRSARDRSFLDFCPGITIDGKSGTCDRRYPDCVRR